MTVYADNAATTQMSDSVLKAMMPLLTDIYGNPSSLHSVGQIAKEHLEAARETVAECIGADPKEIYFTSGGSEADNQAILTGAYLGAVNSILFQVSLNIMLFFTRLMRSKKKDLRLLFLTFIQTVSLNLRM